MIVGENSDFELQSDTGNYNLRDVKEWLATEGMDYDFKFELMIGYIRKECKKKQPNINQIKIFVGQLIRMISCIDSIEEYDGLIEEFNKKFKDKAVEVFDEKFDDLNMTANFPYVDTIKELLKERFKPYLRPKEYILAKDRVISSYSIPKIKCEPTPYEWGEPYYRHPDDGWDYYVYSEEYGDYFDDDEEYDDEYDFDDEDELLLKNDEIVEKIYEMIKAKYPDKISLSIKSDEIIKYVQDNYLIGDEGYECISYIRYIDEAKITLKDLMEKYSNETRFVEYLKIIYNSLPDLKKRFDEKCSINISMGSEEFDKRVKNRIQTAVSLAHIDTEKLVIQWNEELIKSKYFVLTPSDIIVQLPSKFLKDMDREYELYTFKDRENKYANELASLIVRYCRAPSGRKYNLQSVKDALANDFKRRQAKREEKAFEKYAQRISDSENKTSSDDISSSEDRSSRLK